MNRFEPELRVAFDAALAAAQRNSHKKHYREESLPKLWEKAKEEDDELYIAWLSEDKIRALEELGDAILTRVMVWAHSFYLGQDLSQDLESNNYHLGDE